MPGTRGLRAQQSPPENLTGLEGREREKWVSQHRRLLKDVMNWIEVKGHPLSRFTDVSFCIAV